MTEKSPLHGWHLKKEVTIGQILSIVTIIIAFSTWALSLETRISVLEVNDKNFVERMNRDDRRVEANLNDIKISLRRIENRLMDGKQ